MSRKNHLLFFILLSIWMLTACGRREVQYDVPSMGPETSIEQNAQQDLNNALGVENGYRWKDTFEGADHSIWEIDALVTCPEEKNIYTLKANKVYYSNADKKRITNYFLDEDTIQVNTKTATIEDLQMTKEQLKKISESGERTAYTSEDAYKTYLNYIDYQIEKAPSKGELTDTIHDYSENNYIGTKNGVTYTISFNNEKTINTSAFVVKRAQGLGEYTEFYGNLNSSANTCKLSVEEAEEKALAIIKDLGLPSMQKTGVNDLCQWFVNAAGYDRRDVNGYYFHFARDIGGITVDNALYNADNKDMLQTEDFPYLREFVDIGIDDNGLVFLNCAGMLTDGDIEPVDHLLSFEYIKKIVNEALMEYTPSTTNLSNTIKEVTFVYLRVSDTSTTETFHYIPAWRISPYYIDNNVYVTFEDLIWINAIDGTVLDGKKDGIITSYNQMPEADRLAPLVIE